MGKPNVVYTYNGILFSLKMKGNSDTWVNREDTMLSESSQPQKEKYFNIPLI